MNVKTIAATTTPASSSHESGAAKYFHPQIINTAGNEPSAAGRQTLLMHSKVEMRIFQLK